MPTFEQSKENNNLQKSKAQQVQLHSQEVHEILSFIPNWIIRWGISLVVGIILLVLVGTWFIKYPEVVPAKVSITSKNPPKAVIARTAGNISLVVTNGDKVQEGQPLAVIESSADYTDVKTLQHAIKSINLAGDSVTVELQIIKRFHNLELGSVQSTFETFLQQSRALIDFKSIGFYQRKISHLDDRISRYKVLNDKLNEQQETFSKEYKISAKKMKMDSILYKSNSISELKYDNTKLSLLQNKRKKVDAATTILNNELQINQLQGQISELKLEYKQKRSELYRSVSKSIELVKNSIASWKKKYVLTAPVSGQVTFFEVWSDNQFIEQGDEVMNVVPEEKSLFGLLRMPMAKSGKVQTGQKVNIKLSNYPYQQYGMLVGRVKTISLVPKKDVYLIYVSLPAGLKTTYGNTLEFKQKMQGSAEIVTDDLRLTERIFYQLRRIFGKI